jgi:hypothetical protein
MSGVPVQLLGCLKGQWWRCELVQWGQVWRWKLERVDQTVGVLLQRCPGGLLGMWQCQVVSMMLGSLKWTVWVVAGVSGSGVGV